MAQDVMTTTQVGEALGMTASGVRWLVDTGQLRALRAGRYRLIAADDVRRLEQARRANKRREARSER